MPSEDGAGAAGCDVAQSTEVRARQFSHFSLTNERPGRRERTFVKLHNSRVVGSCRVGLEVESIASQ